MFTIANCMNILRASMNKDQVSYQSRIYSNVVITDIFLIGLTSKGFSSSVVSRTEAAFGNFRSNLLNSDPPGMESTLISAILDFALVSAHSAIVNGTSIARFNY